MSKVVKKEAEITLELENDSTCGIVTKNFLDIQSKRDKTDCFGQQTVLYNWAEW